MILYSQKTQLHDLKDIECELVVEQHLVREELLRAAPSEHQANLL